MGTAQDLAVLGGASSKTGEVVRAEGVKVRRDALQKKAGADRACRPRG